MEAFDSQTILWSGFAVIILGLLALDLGIFHRASREVKFKESVIWTLVWVSFAMLFCGFITFNMGVSKGVEFLTGYVIEQSLSMDNIFVFVLIFQYFRVPLAYQHRVLFWGVIGAFIMRAIIIFAGTAIVEEFHWILYLFGAFLLYTGVKMLGVDSDGIEPEKNKVIRLVRRFLPVTDDYVEDKFFVIKEGKRWVTPLFLVLIMVETSDLIFAVDSIPAIFAVTTDPFIVYTANIFAILGLRSLYFVLANMVQKFHLLKYGLSAVLVYVGMKMLIAGVYKIPTLFSLFLILLLIGGSILLSILKPEKQEA